MDESTPTFTYNRYHLQQLNTVLQKSCRHECLTKPWIYVQNITKFNNIPDLQAMVLLNVSATLMVERKWTSQGHCRLFIVVRLVRTELVVHLRSTMGISEIFGREFEDWRRYVSPSYFMSSDSGHVSRLSLLPEYCTLNFRIQSLIYVFFSCNPVIYNG